MKVKISSVSDNFAINDEFLTGNDWLKTSEMTAGSLRLRILYPGLPPLELTILRILTFDISYNVIVEKGAN